MNWKPFDISELQRVLCGCDRWFLDGGLSLDHFQGRTVRVHGDIDIGVLSEDAVDLLTNFIRSGYTIFDASGGMKPVASPSHQNLSYNYWVSDGKHYKVQVLVYTVLGDEVAFRRNPAVRWPRESFTLKKNNLRIVNPLVIYAFKITARPVEQKDQTDITSLLTFIGSVEA